jgi:hypothetical protein
MMTMMLMVMQRLQKSSLRLCCRHHPCLLLLVLLLLRLVVVVYPLFLLRLRAYPKTRGTKLQCSPTFLLVLVESKKACFSSFVLSFSSA